ncbi:hypothetical protein CN998_21875, partial [Bacillus cereus]
RVQAIIDSNLKFKSWVKQVLAIGGILGFCYLVLYVLCFLFAMEILYNYTSGVLPTEVRLFCCI